MAEETNDAKKEKDDKGDEKKEGGGDALKGVGNLASPEAILMLCIAGVIDIIIAIPIINAVSDILGVIIIGGWYVITRPGQIIKKAVIRFIMVVVFELIPVVSIAPSWTWFVYKTIKDG